MYCLCACAKGQEIFFSGFSHGEVCVHWVSCWLQGWKFHNPTTRKVVISERADFNERYYPGLKEAHSSSPPSSLSLIPSSLLTSHQPSSVFIDHSAVSEDDQVTPAAHPGGEELIAGQPEPAGRISDPPAVPAAPVVSLLLLHLPSVLKMTRTSFFLQQFSHHLLLDLDDTIHSFHLLLILHLLENASGGLYIMVCLPHLLLLLPLSLDVLFQLHLTLHLHLHLYLLAHPLLLQLSHHHSLLDTQLDIT